MHNNEDVKELERLRKMGADVYTDPSDMAVYVEGHKILKDGEWDKKALLNCMAKSERDMSLNLYYHEKMVFDDEIPVKIFESNDILFGSIAFADLDIFEIFEKCLAKYNTTEYNNSNIELIVSLRAEGVELYSSKIVLEYDRYKNLRLLFKLPCACEGDIQLVEDNKDDWDMDNLLKYFTKHRHYYHDLKVVLYDNIRVGSNIISEDKACLFLDKNIILSELDLSYKLLNENLYRDNKYFSLPIKIFYKFAGSKPNDKDNEWVELLSKTIKISKIRSNYLINLVIPIEALENSDKIIIL